MALQDIVLYICKHYPMPSELSKARLTKMVYLADWEHCLKTGRQLTSINWYFNNFGPYVDDVINAARTSDKLLVIETENFYGERKELIKAVENAPDPRIEEEDAEIIDAVIDKTRRLYWNDFMKLVYSTPPISGSNRYTNLNLESFARKARANPNI